MPTNRVSKPRSKPLSTDRRKILGAFVQKFGDVMPRACSNCRRANRECRVHVRSGVCGECHLRGGTCDIRITQEEWQRLMSERDRITQALAEAQAAQQAAHARIQRAEEERLRASQQESSLRVELRKLEVEAEEAIAVEETQILALERQEALEALADKQLPAESSSGLAMSPYTWSATEGLPDEYWASSSAVPWVIS